MGLFKKKAKENKGAPNQQQPADQQTQQPPPSGDVNPENMAFARQRGWNYFQMETTQPLIPRVRTYPFITLGAVDGHVIGAISQEVYVGKYNDNRFAAGTFCWQIENAGVVSEYRCGVIILQNNSYPGDILPPIQLYPRIPNRPAITHVFGDVNVGEPNFQQTWSVDTAAENTAVATNLLDPGLQEYLISLMATEVRVGFDGNYTTIATPAYRISDDLNVYDPTAAVVEHYMFAKEEIEGWLAVVEGVSSYAGYLSDEEQAEVQVEPTAVQPENVAYSIPPDIPQAPSPAIQNTPPNTGATFDTGEPNMESFTMEEFSASDYLGVSPKMKDGASDGRPSDDDLRNIVVVNDKGYNEEQQNSLVAEDVTDDDTFRATEDIVMGNVEPSTPAEEVPFWESSDAKEAFGYDVLAQLDAVEIPEIDETEIPTTSAPTAGVPTAPPVVNVEKPYSPPPSAVSDKTAPVAYNSLNANIDAEIAEFERMAAAGANSDKANSPTVAAEPELPSVETDVAVHPPVQTGSTQISHDDDSSIVDTSWVSSLPKQRVPPPLPRKR